MGVKALIFDRENKVLLLERNHPVKRMYWDLPGGRLQKNESVINALIREVQEEIGLSGVHFYPLITILTNIRIPIQQDESVGLIFSIFKCHLSSIFHPILSTEHIDFEWITPLQASEKLKSQYPEEFIEKLSKM
jgi:8-oxo-dGTP pyrophosphatase MutT (NUDIX family)